MNDGSRHLTNLDLSPDDIARAMLDFLAAAQFSVQARNITAFTEFATALGCEFTEDVRAEMLANAIILSAFICAQRGLPPLDLSDIFAAVPPAFPN